ncbi:biotin synthase BioB [bacterium]|nr:biotin synthase BioB [bacterium]
MTPYREWADRVLGGGSLTREEAGRCLETPTEELDELTDAVFSVRKAHWGRRVKICVLNNIRSGLCQEDCGYCSQSKDSGADIPVYSLKSSEAIYEGARRAHEEAGAKRYCIVASGRGPSDRDIDHLAATIQKIRADFPLEICCSLGLLDEDKAVRLKRAGAGWINHNLNTSERFYPRICSTHTWRDRVNTIRAVKSAGLKTCSGGIVGMGETADDVLDMAFAIQDLDIDSIPVNFLHPIAGTPLAGRGRTSIDSGMATLCLFRLLNPSKDIRAAGGREFTFGPDAYRVLYPANSIFVEGYLTTPGDEADQARQAIEEMGFEVEA